VSTTKSNSENNMEIQLNKIIRHMTVMMMMMMMLQ